jgi:hypothetical protein
MENAERNAELERRDLRVEASDDAPAGDVPLESSGDAPLEPPGAEEVPPMQIDYSLRWTGWPSLGQLVAVAVAAAVYTVLSWVFTEIGSSGIPVVSSIFIPIGFGIPFAMWFGGWAFVIAYIGNFVGAGLLSQMPLPIALWFGTVDLIQLGLPMLLYRFLAPRFGVSPIGKDVFTKRGFIFFALCAALPNNIIGGLYGNFILVRSGLNPPSTFFPGWFVWSLSNIVITLIVGSILLKALGPVVERFGLTVRNLLN